MTAVGEERELSFWRRSRRLDRLVARYIVVLAAVLGIVIITFASLASLDAQMRAADAERYAAQQVLHLQTDEATGLRTYQATGNAAYLQPYLSARKELDNVLTFLRNSARDFSEVEKRLDEFAIRHFVWEGSVAAPILDRRIDAGGIGRADSGKTLLDAMRGDMEAVNLQYQKRIDVIEGQRQLVRNGSYALILFAILLVAVYGYFVESASAQREERLLRSVVAQRDTVARQSEWRTKIIAILAHDFRTSLSVIQANAELLEDHPEPYVQTTAFRAIYKGVSDLSAMTDEALLMARVANESLVITPEPVSIGNLIADVADRFSARQDIRVAPYDGYVMGDEGYLARVFDNVISNAVKYSNGPIDVNIDALEGNVEIAIVDRGPGIDAADLPHVFEEYWRAESARGKRGSGIGLYIVKKIIDAHHGTVNVESSAGEGTRVRIVLPCAIPVQPLGN